MKNCRIVFIELHLFSKKTGHSCETMAGNRFCKTNYTTDGALK